MIPNDPYGAFCRHTHVALDGAPAGPLHGLTFAVKDVYDIAGHRTGNGNPVWLDTHPPAARTASAVERLLAAGATMVGKTQTDELAYSLNGENVHYGTPTNPRAPGRIPGGSSSGSAVAVAGGLVDFALGTDCGGSVRLPASYCGIYGIRTSHGLVPIDGVADLAASFDTVGWFARDAAMMRRVGDVMLPAAPAFAPKRLLIATDAFAFAGDDIAAALTAAVTRLKSASPGSSGGQSLYRRSIRLVGNFPHPAGRRNPPPAQCLDRRLSSDLRSRHRRAFPLDAHHRSRRSRAHAAAARSRGFAHGRASWRRCVLVPADGAGHRAKAETPAAELEAFRARAFALLSIAGLARLPQLSLPLGAMADCPLGLSLIAPRGRDRGLLAWAAERFF